jgi:hypothetical protein
MARVDRDELFEKLARFGLDRGCGGDEAGQNYRDTSVAHAT